MLVGVLLLVIYGVSLGIFVKEFIENERKISKN